MNFEPARWSIFKIFKTRISSWSWISSHLEDRNSIFFENPNFELEMNFEPARRTKFKMFKSRISGCVRVIVSATCLSAPPLDIPYVNYYIFVSYKTATCSTQPTATNFHPQMAKITRSNGQYKNVCRHVGSNIFSVPYRVRTVLHYYFQKSVNLFVSLKNNLFKMCFVWVNCFLYTCIFESKRKKSEIIIVRSIFLFLN
jgi:hypothetical protein